MPYMVNHEPSFSCLVGLLPKHTMANVGNVLSKKTSTNQGSFEVITLSSDEEDLGQNHDNLNFLFNRFILACRPYVTKESVKNARSLFTEVQEKLTTAHDLGDRLKRYGREIKETNADLYLNLVIEALNEEKRGNNSTHVGENHDINKVAKCVTFCDVNEAREFKPTTTSLCTNLKGSSTSRLEIATISDDDDLVSEKPSKRLTENVENMPSTSTAHEPTSTGKEKGKISTKTLTEKQKKRLAARLKLRLKKISSKIKILNRAELTLEEMDMSDSTYIQESRLKKKFEETWNKLCKILGRLPNTGRVIEKPIRCSSTGYSMIDKAVAKFLKERQNSFPDYFDIRDIVLKVNKKHDLRMSPSVLNGIIADIFTDVGNKLQHRRERDLLFNFGSHLLDDFRTENDPALSDEDLAKRLEKNRKISKHNLKKVYAKYTHLERYEQDDKSRKSGSSKMKGYMSTESSLSDDEPDQQKSEKRSKHDRLARREILGKLQKPGSSRGSHGDISDESSSSDDEQDDSKMESDNNLIVIEDSDLLSSQESSFIDAKPTTSSDMSLSISHAEGSSEVLLSDSERPESPTFPLTCHSIKDNETGSSEQAISTAFQNTEKKEHGKSVNKSPVDELHQDTGNDQGLVNDLLEQEDFDEPVSKSQSCAGDEVVDRTFISELEPSTCDDCVVVDTPQEQKKNGKRAYEPTIIDDVLEDVQSHEKQLMMTNDVEPSISERHPSVDDCQIVSDPKEQKQLGKHVYGPTIIDDVLEDVQSHKMPSVSHQQQSINDDCKVASEPQEQKQNVKPAYKPSFDNDDFEVVQNHKKTLMTMKHNVEPSVSDRHPGVDDDCQVVSDPHEQKKFNKTVEKPNIDSDSELIQNARQQPETMDLDQPEEPSVSGLHQNTDDDCLIIDDDEDVEPIKSSEKQLKISTSSPSKELIKTLNTLREIFRAKSNPLDQSKSAASSCDESGKVNSVGQATTDTICSSKHSAIKESSWNSTPETSSTVTQTVTAKASSEQCVSNNTGDFNAPGNSGQDDDIVMFDKEQCSDSNTKSHTLTCRPPNSKVETSNTIKKMVSNEPSKRSGEDQPNFEHHQSPTRSKTSNFSPSPLNRDAHYTNNEVNPRKRKANAELTLQIPKSSVKCLEQLALALKNKTYKRLKLPDGWVNSGVENSNASESKQTTSKDSPTVSPRNTPAESEPTTSKGSPTISQTLTSSENNSDDVKDKTKINLQQRQVFREKTLNALKTPTKPVCGNNNMDGIAGLQTSPVISSISLLTSGTDDNAEKCEVIVIDD